MTAQGLIDTTEMYLRTIFARDEEGVTPPRARIAQGPGQTGPTVSQMVARMERDGLLHLLDDRQLALSDIGHTPATRVMRQHRLAERRQPFVWSFAEVDQWQVGDVSGSPYRDDTRQCACLSCVDRYQPAMRMGRTDDTHMQLMGK